MSISVHYKPFNFITNVSERREMYFGHQIKLCLNSHVILFVTIHICFQVDFQL